MRRAEAQIVATIGPASRDLVEDLGDAGSTSFRLNSSHLRLEELAEQAERICRALPDCPVIVDLQGAKMRVGQFDARSIRAGERIRFAFSAAGEEIPLPHREIYAAVARGDTLGCDDDRLRFEIARVSEDALETVALGVTAELGKVGYAFSFMRDGTEAEWIRRRAPDCAVVEKVERSEAAENIHLLSAAVDAVWICRGDLGAQLGLAAMARWISAYDPRTEGCPVLMAGQVLEHLTAHAAPTRSEVCHLFDLAGRGYGGFVLSDETAIGADPAGAVRTLRSLLAEFRGQAP
jgi:pyruvate kinase